MATVYIHVIVPKGATRAEQLRMRKPFSDDPIDQEWHLALDDSGMPVFYDGDKPLTSRITYSFDVSRDQTMIFAVTTE